VTKPSAKATPATATPAVAKKVEVKAIINKDLKKEKDLTTNLIEIVDDIVNTGKAVLESQGSSIQIL